MNFTLPAQPLSCSTRITANALDSFGAKIPSTPSEPSAALYRVSSASARL